MMQIMWQFHHDKQLVSMINMLLDKENLINLELRRIFINRIQIRYSLEYLLNFDFLSGVQKRVGSVILKTDKMDDIKYLPAFIIALLG
jgi:hypothetical protein